MERHPDVVVIGAGIMGLGIAVRLGEAGRRVLVCDPAGPGTETSRVSAGMLAPRAEVRHDEHDLLAFGGLAQRLWPGWVEHLHTHTGIAIDLRTPGTLVVATDEDELRAVERHLEWLERIDVPHERLDPPTLRELEPELAHPLQGGALIHGDGQVDNRTLLAALQRRAEALGVTMLQGRAVARVHAPEGPVTAVECDDGTRIPCEQAVVAAGAWSRTVRIDGLPPLPVRPVRGQLLAFGSTDRHGRKTTVRHAIHAPEVYMAQKADGTLLVGASMEERGFEREVNTGALYLHLREGRRLLPQLDELPLQEIRIGFRPTTRDNRPLIGETHVAGAFCITGHFRNGVQQAPASIEALAALMLGADPIAEALPFSPRRFPTA